MDMSTQQSHPPTYSPPTAADFFTPVVLFPPSFLSIVFPARAFAEFQCFSDSSRSAIYFSINAGKLILAKSLPNRTEII